MSGLSSDVDPNPRQPSAYGVPILLERNRRQEREQRTTLEGILRAALVVLALMLATSPLRGRILEAVAVYGSGLMLQGAHLYWLSRSSRCRSVAASYTLTYFCWGTFVIAYRFGGLSAPVAFVYPPMIVMTGLVWSGQAAVLMAFVSAATSAGLLILQIKGHLPPAQPDSSWVLLAVFSGSVIMTATMMRFALRIINNTTTEALNQSRNLADLVSAAPDGMVFIDAQGQIVEANPALRDLLLVSEGREADLARGGYWAQNLKGSHICHWVSPPARAEFLAQLSRVREESLSSSWESSLCAAELPAAPELVPSENPVLRRQGHGTAIPVEVRARLLEESHSSKGSRLLHLSLRDLTDREARLQLERELNRARQLEALAVLAGGIAHDFNNLLTAISGHTELAKLSLKPSESASPRLVHSLDSVLEASTRASKLTQKLLGASRRQLITPEPTDLRKHIKRFVDSALTELQPNTRLDLSPSSTPLRTQVDPQLLDEVLKTLLCNAQEAMPDGGTVSIAMGRRSGTEHDVTQQGSRTPEIGQQATPTEATTDWVYFTVRDQGAGLPAKVRERIFEPFFSTKRFGEGAGLNLTSAYGSILQSGGTMTVFSEPALGTEFLVQLPERLPGTTPPPSPSNECHSRRAQGENPSVLVVDDESSLRSVLRLMLSHNGFSVTEATGGQHALELLKAEPPALLITDIIMPNMTGVELAEQARLLYPELRVLFVSGYSGEHLSRSGLPNTIPVLAKPFTQQQLLSLVHQLLDS